MAQTKKLSRIGSRQHRFMYGGPNCWERRPFKFRPVQGRPPEVLRGLIEKGWMWASRSDVRKWGPRKEDWVDSRLGDCWCGLTLKGLEIIKAIRDHNMKEYEDEQ